VQVRYIGIDYGSKKVGIARSDTDGRLAFPEEVVPNDTELAERIGAIANRLEAKKIVIGDTRGMSGESNAVTPELEAFVGALKSNLSVPVVLSSEFLTTQEAGRYTKRGEDKDASAAALILQRYLDKQNNE